MNFFRKQQPQTTSGDNAASKYQDEINFWRNELTRYQQWYNGEITELYEEPSPKEEQKVKARNLKDSALLTFFNVHQKTKYLEDLQLPKNAFDGLKVLDVGSGPFPSASAFEGADLFCLDPLVPAYIEAGFPLHYYDNARFIHSFAEDMPVEDGFFDAAISVNAIDHVDDFFKTAQEIKRVLKPGGKVRMHMHYHEKALAEPIELNDEIVSKAFSWCEGFKRISDSKSKRGHTLTNENELYTLWSNF